MLSMRSQLPSIAASLVGWYLSTPRPCRSPMKICTGTKIVANHSAMDRERREPASFASGASCGWRSSIQADMPADREGRREVAAHHHMRVAQGEGRIEDDLEPIDRHRLAVLDGEPDRRLHPGIRGEDPESRDQRAQSHHAGGEEMQPVADAAPSRRA